MFLKCVDFTSLCIVHIPKWKQIDLQIFVALVNEKLTSHFPTAYKTKLQYNLFEHSRKKMLHYSSCFHFDDVNIAPLHMTIPFKKSHYEK